MADVNANIGVNIDTTQALAQLKALQRQISQFHTSIAKSSETAALAQRDLQRNFINAVNSIGAFSAELRTVKTTAESFTDSLEKNKFSMREYFRYAGASTKTFGKLFKSEFDTIGKVAEDRVKKLQTQYIKLGRDTTGAMKAIAIIPNELDMKNFSTQTQIAAQRQALFNQLVKQGSTNLLNFGKNTQWAGRQLMVGFTLPLATLGTTAARTFMEMEAAALKFRKVYGDLFTPKEETQQALADVTALGQMFTKYGIAVKDTVSLAADAAAAGFQGIDLQRQTTQATRLSVLGQIDNQKALETTISLQNAFQMSSENLAGAIDFLNAVENQTVVSLDDITTAIPKVAPVIQQLGGDVKDLAFFLAAMKEGGVNASEGANALKSGLASLINPTKKATDMLASMGINIQQIIQANKGNLKATVIQFAQALDTLDPLTRARAIEQLFGKFQFARLSTLFANVTKQTGQAARVLDLAGTSVEDLAALSEQELGITADSAMNKFRKSVEDLKMSLIPVGKTFLEAVTPIVEFVGGILDKFNNLSDGVKKAIVVMTVAIGAIGPVALMAFGLLANGLANIVKGALILRQGYLRLTGQTQVLGEQTDYLTSEQINAAAVAHSLDQSHAKLTQTFNVEAATLNQLITAYQNAARAAASFAATNPGMMMPPRGRGFNKGTMRVKKYEGGVTIVPGSGNGDTVPAMLTPGEAVIPKDKAKQYAPLIQGIIAGNIPGFMAGTLSVGGQTTGLDFARRDTAAKAQQLVDAMLADGSGIENALTIVNETLTRMANDTQISIGSFVREMEVVTKELTGSLLPKSILVAGGRPGERKFSAGQTNVGTMEEQVKGNATLEEELTRARESSKVAQEAMQKYYEDIGIDLTKTDKKTQNIVNAIKQSGEVHRAHIIEMQDNVDKMFDEAWDPNVWVAQSSTLNQVSNILESSKDTRSAYLKNLNEIEIDDKIRASITEKINKNIALTESELVVQKQVLERMLASTESIAKLSPSFKAQATGAIAATEYLMQNPALGVGVGSRTQEQRTTGRQAITNARFRGQQSFAPVTQAAQDVVDATVLETARAAGTQSPSKRTIPIGEDIARGLSVGMMNQADDVAAAANAITQDAITEMRDTGLLGPGGQPLRVPVTQPSAPASTIAQNSSINNETKKAIEDEIKARKTMQGRLDSMNKALMGGTFALTSLAGAGSFAGGALGDLSQAVFKYSGLLFGLMSVTQLLTQAKIAELVATRLAVAKQAAAFASYGAGIAGRSGILGSIARLGIGITKFLGPIGIATTVATGLYVGFKYLQKRSEEARNAVMGLADAANLTANKLKTLGDFFGVLPTKNPMMQAGPQLRMTTTQRGQVEQLKASDAFQNTFGKDISNLKKATAKEAELVFKSLAVSLTGQGFAQEQIQNIIDALREEAGKTDVVIDVKSLNLKTPAGQEQFAQLASDITNQLAAAAKNGYKEIEVLKQGVSTTGQYYRYYAKELAPTVALQKAANASGQELFNMMSGLAGALDSGAINAKEFNQAFDTLENKLKLIEQTNPSASVLMLNAAIKLLNPETQKLFTGLTNTKDVMLMMRAQALGLTAILPGLAEAIKTVNAGYTGDATGLVQAQQKLEAYKKLIAQTAKDQEDFIKKTLKTGDIGGGTGTKSPTQVIKEKTQALNDQVKAYIELRNKGYDAKTAADLAGDSLIAAAIAGSKIKVGSAAWKELINNLRVAQTAADAVAARISLDQQAQNIKTQLDAYNKLVKAGFDAQQAGELVGDVNLATLILNTKSAGMTFDELKKKILEVQNGLNAVKNLGNPFAAIEAQTAVFNKQYDAMMEKFRIQEQKARNQFQPGIDAAQAEVDRIKGVIDGINKEIDKLQTQIQDKQRDIEINITRVVEKYQADITKLEDKIKQQFDKPLQVLSDESDVLNHNLGLIDHQAESINAKYDAQAEALQKVADINAEVAAQEQKRLGLASALSSGDIAAAAAAAQEMRAGAAANAAAGQAGNLEAARKAELNAITVEGMTKQQIEQRLYAIGQQQYVLEQGRKAVQKEIADIEEFKIAPLLADKAIKEAAIRDLEDQIYQKQNGQTNSIRSNNILLDDANNKLTIAQQALQDELDKIEAQKKKWEDAKLRIDEAKNSVDTMNISLQTSLDLVNQIVAAWAAAQAAQAAAAVGGGGGGGGGDGGGDGTDNTGDTGNTKTTTKTTTTKTTTPTTTKTTTPKTTTTKPSTSVTMTGGNKLPPGASLVLAANKAKLNAGLNTVPFTSLPSGLQASIKKDIINKGANTVPISSRPSLVVPTKSTGSNTVPKSSMPFGGQSAIPKKKAFGGIIQKMASGGFVPGIGLTDKVPALLTPGEFVMNRGAAKSFAPFLNSLNDSKYPSMIGRNMSSPIYSVAAPNNNYAMPTNNVSTSVNDNSSTVYNYSVGITVGGTNSSPDSIAKAVLNEIKYIDSQRIRNQRA